ncbi:MAG: hypothetical protein CVU71_14145 [Deltaproteobacteria bacterium HGW-Deltaproteobacteria-6]|jgi:hypothetical protein|nr:MAG: hypothetical protein CVU71_14145 [Deltaproteobacteria bacterium HGW-Deltaproteobacteria-6]
MGLILYSQATEGSGKRLLEIIKGVASNHKLEIYSSIDELTERLHQPLMDVGVAVLHAATHSELMDMIYLGNILSELRVVLVLPDNEPEAIEKAHILHPRFIASAENDYKHLGSVLKRMMELYGKTC